MNASLASPQTYARIGSVLYLILIAAGMFGELFARGWLIVSGNPVASASHIAGDIVMHMCTIGVMLSMALWLLVKGVNLAKWHSIRG